MPFFVQKCTLTEIRKTPVRYISQGFHYVLKSVPKPPSGRDVIIRKITQNKRRDGFAAPLDFLVDYENRCFAFLILVFFYTGEIV